MGAVGCRGKKRRRGPMTAAPHLETLLWRVGLKHVAGVDEVGMGPLAGPVIAAAVVAKVHRDGLMRDLDRLYPGYGFARHMGYSTRAHFAAIREYGPSPIHRRSFAPVRAAVRGVTDTQLPLAPVTGFD